MSTHAARPAVNLAPSAAARPGIALVLALLSVAGVTITWDQSGFAGTAVGLAAIVLGLQRSRLDEKGTRKATVAIAVAPLAVLSVVLFLLVGAPGAQAAQPVRVSCGDTLTADTTLANDLANCPGNGLIIGADGITLDLNGHTIDGDGVETDGCPQDESCDVGVVNSGGEDGHAFNRPGHDDVTIKNGTIKEFWEEGVFALTVRDNSLRGLKLPDNVNHGVSWVEVDHSRIESVTVKGSLQGLIVGHSRHVRIEGSSVSGSEFGGITVSGGSQHAVVANNTVADIPDGDGIRFSSGSKNNVARGNSVMRALAGVGLDNSNGNLVKENSLRDNVFVGAYLYGADDSQLERNTIVGNSDGEEGGIHLLTTEEGNSSDRNVLSANALTGNDGDGILVDAGQRRTLVEDNQANRNSDDGIDVDATATTLTDNTANRNGDLGIEAVARVTDGGGNRATGNGNPLQCTNVFCKQR